MEVRGTYRNEWCEMYVSSYTLVLECHDVSEESAGIATLHLNKKSVDEMIKFLQTVRENEMV